jgi:hypothetical protein
MRLRSWGALGVLLGLLCLASTAAADQATMDLGRAGCDQTIARLEKQLSHTTLLGTIFAAAGAGLAALGSAVAGASTGRRAWIAGAVGVVGAIVTALPKTALPDRVEIQRRLSLADQHRNRGVKTVLQIPLLEEKAFVIQCQQYAIARFVDCSADEPSKEVPELPREVASEVAAAPEVRAHEKEGAAPEVMMDEKMAGTPKIEAHHKKTAVLPKTTAHQKKTGVPSQAAAHEETAATGLTGAAQVGKTAPSPRRPPEYINSFQPTRPPAAVLPAPPR